LITLIPNVLKLYWSCIKWKSSFDIVTILFIYTTFFIVKLVLKLVIKSCLFV